MSMYVCEEEMMFNSFPHFFVRLLPRHDNFFLIFSVSPARKKKKKWRRLGRRGFRKHQVQKKKLRVKQYRDT